MDAYLEDHPEDRPLFKTLQRLSTTASISISEYLCHEALELIHHIYTRRLYRSRDVRKTLKTVVRKEKSDVEKMVYSMFCKRSIVFRDFSLKLAFTRNFARFRKFFVDGNDVEYEMQRLVHRYRYLKEDVVKEAEAKIFDLPPGKVHLYLHFFGSAFSPEIVMRILDHVDIGIKPLIASFLPKKEHYEQLSRLILSSSPDDKVLLISSIGEMDKIQFYKSLSEACMVQTTINKQRFREFIDIMKMVNVDRETKMKILYGWLRVFVYLKRLDDFVRLFEQIRRLDGSGREYEAFRSFYGAIYEYKRCGKLDLTDFLIRCEEGEEENPFSIYKWKEVYRVYKG